MVHLVRLHEAKPRGLFHIISLSGGCPWVLRQPPVKQWILHLSRECDTSKSLREARIFQRQQCKYGIQHIYV